MTAALTCVGAIVATYSATAAAWLGVPHWQARRRERALAYQAELIAIDVWLQQIRDTA
jgi:hypothetical protein